MTTMRCKAELIILVIPSYKTSHVEVNLESTNFYNAPKQFLDDIVLVQETDLQLKFLSH